MGKPEEALSVCLEAKELLHKNISLSMDDLTLSTLQIVLQRLDRCKYARLSAYYLMILLCCLTCILFLQTVDLATSLYDYACNKIPNNLELMMGLFNCYVREYAYVKQQQVDGFFRLSSSFIWFLKFLLGSFG